MSAKKKAKRECADEFDVAEDSSDAGSEHSIAQTSTTASASGSKRKSLGVS